MRVLVAVALLTIGAAGCSGKDDGAGPDVAGPSPATDAAGPVVASVVSTTTTTTTTAPTTVAPSSAPPTIAAPLTTAGPASGPYQPTTAPTFPSRSTPPPAEGLPDGSYYAVVRGAAADAPRVATTIYQLLTGPGRSPPRGPATVSTATSSSPSSPLRIATSSSAPTCSSPWPGRTGRRQLRHQRRRAARLVNGRAPARARPTQPLRALPYLITVAVACDRLEQLWAP
jgi:hypothetical protein